MSRLKKRPDGRYQATCTYLGKRYYFTASTMSGAQKKRDAFLESKRTCTYSSSMLLKEWAIRWLIQKQPNIEMTTFETYECNMNNHIIPKLGAYPLCNLQPPIIRDFVTELAGKLAPHTVDHIYKELHEMLEQAVNDDLLVKNPMRGVSKPKLENVRPWVALTEKQVQSLIDAVDYPKHKLLIKMAVATGFRRSELLGVRVQDIDLEKGTVSITQTVKKKDGVAHIMPTTKTKLSRRTVSLPMGLIPEIRTMIRDNRLEAMWDHLWEPHGLLFSGLHGAPMHPDYVSELIKDAGKKAKLPKGFTMNSLRHTHASLLLEKGANYKVVQQRLGHSTAKLTLDTYSHLMPGQDRDAAELLANII